MIMTFLYIIAWIGFVVGLLLTIGGVVNNIDEKSPHGELRAQIRGYRREYHVLAPTIITAVCLAWIIASHLS